jgi:WhiB family transcriptional regulator, redox-sensing transcriptional regulator
MTVHMNWREDVARRDADPGLFFPIGTTGTALRQMEEAKRICRVCPVQIQCLAWHWATGSPMACGAAPRQTSGTSSGPFPEERQSVRNMTMTRVITQQSTENMEYVRMVLQEKQPGFSAALELALELLELEPRPPQMSAGTQPVSVPDVRIGNGWHGGFARDFAAADGKRVMVAALTRQQFVDLARTTTLGRIFAFLERLLPRRLLHLRRPPARRREGLIYEH